jgi:NADH-quinone oxidoreductase subunit C
MSAAADALRETLDDALEEVTSHAGQESVRVRAGRLLEVCRFLRDDPRCRMNLLSDLSALDFPGEPERFEVNYHLYSIPRRERIRVKVRTAEGRPLPTVSGIWPTANWHEREAYDLFGIVFEGHPDLTRILLPDDWKGHPLRKEYPLEGLPEQHPRFR